jgi:radical SAM superfamily enzyme YgiQ (UPF0313 family)
MNKIIFVNPALGVEQRYGKSAKDTMHHTPPQGLCHLAAVLREKEYEVEILDAEVFDYTDAEVLERVKEYSPDYIGITSTIVTIYTAARYVKLFKEHFENDVKVILGGPQITASPEDTMKLFPQLDVGVLGEGEITIVELLEAFENGKTLEDINGLIFVKNGRFIKTPKGGFIKNLDSLPMPAWDLLPNIATHYRTSEITCKKLPAFQITTSRGCPYKCTFCDRSVFGNRWRGFSAEYVIEMIKELVNKYGIRDINFSDDEFLINRKRLEKICHFLINEGIDLSWSAVGRADSVRSDLLKLMKEAGCHQISIGIESGSQKILDIIKKATTIEVIERCVEWTKEAGIEVKGSFMIGCPLETKETIKETFDLIERLDIDYISMSAFTPLPGTEIYKTATNYGSFDNDWKKMNLWQPVFIPTGLTKDYLVNFIGRYAHTHKNKTS